MPRKLWERMDGESAKAFAAFCAYLELGDERSVRAVGQKLDKSRTQIGKWSAAFKWVERAAAYDAEQWRAEREQEKRDAQRSGARKSQVGMGMRNEKIRTYNFPQDRVTDHRIGLTQHNIEGFMDGNLDSMIDALTNAARQKSCKAAAGSKPKSKQKQAKGVLFL